MSEIVSEVIKKGELEYTVEYYYNNVKDETKTEYLTGELGETISEYTDKKEIGYLLDEASTKPINIELDEKKNVLWMQRINNIRFESTRYNKSDEYE